MEFAKLSRAQQDGRACVFCGREDTAMTPAGRTARGQAFRCAEECRAPGERGRPAQTQADAQRDHDEALRSYQAQIEIEERFD